MIRTIFIIFSLLYVGVIWSQEDPENILTANTKDLITGDIQPLINRLDPNVNYIIDAGSFTNGRVNRDLQGLLTIKDYLKQTYNLEIIILVDDHWDELIIASDKKDERGWDFDLYILNDKFDFFNISPIPTYFFVTAGSTAPTQRGLSVDCENLDDFLRNELYDSSHPAIINDIKQTITKDCASSSFLKINSQDKEVFENEEYTRVGNLFLKEDLVTGNIYQYNDFFTDDALYLDFHLPICSNFMLVDKDGDQLEIKIVDSYVENGHKHLVSDKNIFSDCQEDIPFEIISRIGTNAGLLFDIEDEQIVSRLVCHMVDDSLTYYDNDIGLDCITTSTNNLIDDEIKLYPNPTRKSLTLELFWPGTTAIQIHNAQGQEVISQMTREPVINFNLELLPEGMYILTLKNGETIRTKKIAKLN